jgi:hypothetical protein
MRFAKAHSPSQEDTRKVKTQATVRNVGFGESCPPFALAGYGGARHQEIQVLDWEHVNLDVGGGELAGDEAGRKPGGSWRLIFYVKPLWECCARSGRRKDDRRAARFVRRRRSANPVCSLSTLSSPGCRNGGTNRDLSRSACTSHATRRRPGSTTPASHPRSFSEFVGHKTPEYQLGAARITLQVYTHMLPGELERARTLFDEFLIERAEEDPAPGLALAKV